jgi:hypothetical protein
MRIIEGPMDQEIWRNCRLPISGMYLGDKRNGLKSFMSTFIKKWINHQTATFNDFSSLPWGKNP